MITSGYAIEPGADLLFANLRGADLTDADLSGADEAREIEMAERSLR